MWITQRIELLYGFSRFISILNFEKIRSFWPMWRSGEFNFRSFWLPWQLKCWFTLILRFQLFWVRTVFHAARELWINLKSHLFWIMNWIMSNWSKTHHWGTNQYDPTTYDLESLPIVWLGYCWMVDLRTGSESLHGLQPNPVYAGAIEDRIYQMKWIELKNCIKIEIIIVLPHMIEEQSGEFAVEVACLCALQVAVGKIGHSGHCVRGCEHNNGLIDISRVFRLQIEVAIGQYIM